MKSDDIQISTEDGLVIARVQAPHLEEDHAQLLLQELLPACEKLPTAPVLVNLSQVTTMPSMAIGALVTLWKKLQDRKQRLILVGAQGAVRHTLAVCRLDKLFEFSESEGEAKKRVNPTE